jgi:hypothetical protein
MTAARDQGRRDAPEEQFRAPTTADVQLKLG